MKKFASWLLGRLKEKSTWAGVLTVVTAAGVAIKPELKEAIISTGVSVAGLAAILLKDKDSE